MKIKGVIGDWKFLKSKKKKEKEKKKNKKKESHKNYLKYIYMKFALKNRVFFGKVIVGYKNEN